MAHIKISKLQLGSLQGIYTWNKFRGCYGLTICAVKDALKMHCGNKVILW